MRTNLDERILEIGRRHFPSQYFEDITRELYRESGQAYISVLEEIGGSRKKARLWRSVPHMDQEGHVDWRSNGVIESPGKVDLHYLLNDCEEISRNYYYREPGTQAVIYRMKR